MKFIITFVSASDELVNASRRASPICRKLEDSLAGLVLTDGNYEKVIFFIIEKSLGKNHFLDFYKEQRKNKNGYVTVAVGIDPNLTFAPEDDSKFLRFISDRIKFFVGKSRLQSEDATSIVENCDRIFGR